MICLISPFFTKIHGETHHRVRYSKYPKMAVIGFIDTPDDEGEILFKMLVKRNAINFHSPAYQVCVLKKDQDDNSIKEQMNHLFNQIEIGRDFE